MSYSAAYATTWVHNQCSTKPRHMTQQYSNGHVTKWQPGLIHVYQGAATSPEHSFPVYKMLTVSHPSTAYYSTHKSAAKESTLIPNTPQKSARPCKTYDVTVEKGPIPLPRPTHALRSKMWGFHLAPQTREQAYYPYSTVC